MGSGKILSFWQDENYYKCSREGSLDISNPGMKVLFKYGKRANSILDLGCGEGTRLNWVVNGRKIRALGMDISPVAIKIAKKQYPNIKFEAEDLEGERVKEAFDLVYSAYVLEHLEDPEKFIRNAISYVQNNGRLIFIAPNFGSPNRRSPNSVEGKIKKLIDGFINDFSMGKSSSLIWKKVVPLKKTYDVPDDDALSEPYIWQLIKYLNAQDLRVIYSSSMWEIEPWSWNLRKSLFKFLGLLGIFPFKFWGPQFVIVTEND